MDVVVAGDGDGFQRKNVERTLIILRVFYVCLFVCDRRLPDASFCFTQLCLD